jgi:hypothetical protein
VLHDIDVELLDRAGRHRRQRRIDSLERLERDALGLRERWSGRRAGLLDDLRGRRADDAGGLVAVGLREGDDRDDRGHDGDERGQAEADRDPLAPHLLRRLGRDHRRFPARMSR